MNFTYYWNTTDKDREELLNKVMNEMTQEEAFSMFRNLETKFSWSGTVFTPDDVQECIINRREADGLEPLTDEQLEEAVYLVVDSRDWSKWLPDWMTEQGWEIINTAIFDILENANN